LTQCSTNPILGARVSNNRSFEEAKGEKANRRDEILDAAGQLFSRQGFHATSMRDLARAVNLQGGSLYAHIQSKEEVLFELVNRAADEFLSSAEAISPDLSPKEQLERLVRGHLEVIVRELDNATVFFHEWKFLNPELQRKITARRDAYEAHFRRVIEEGVQQGQFQVEDVRLAALFVLSALNWTYHWYRPGGKLTLEALSNQYCTLIFRTLDTR
jgi:AcrR family transcriptional regulator